VWLKKLMGEELEHYVIEETNVTRELEKSTTEWATLYLLQTRSNYATPDTRAVALSNMFREITATTDWTWQKQGLTVVSEANKKNPDNIGQGRSTSRTQPAKSTFSTAGSQCGANTPGLSATAQAAQNVRLVARLNKLRAQLVIAISTEQTMEAAAAAAILAAQVGNLEDSLPLDAFVAASILATTARTAADSAAATVARLEANIVSTQTEISNLGTARRP
jgi:hypothetical protein